MILNFLIELWEGDEERVEVIEVCYETSKEILGSGVDEVLNYVGIK